MNELIISKPKPSGYLWKPKEDITTYELALCMTILVSSLKGNFDPVKAVGQLPDNARRHFEEVAQ